MKYASLLPSKTVKGQPYEQMIGWFEGLGLLGLFICLQTVTHVITVSSELVAFGLFRVWALGLQSVCSIFS